MKNRVWVNRVLNGWAVIDHETQVGDLHDSENAAHLHAHHYRHAPSLWSTLGFKKAETCSNYRAWTARPFWGVKAFVCKHPQTEWSLLLTVDGDDYIQRTFKTRALLCSAVCAVGRESVMTRNILNPGAGEFPIARNARGGCTDPGTETYHCM